MPSATTQLTRISSPPTCLLRNALLALTLVAIPVGAAAKNKDNGRTTCATTYSVIQQDGEGNVQQGISQAKNLKWTDKDLWKRYPDVCYVAPNPSVKTVFVITATDYERFTLTVETIGSGGKLVIQRTFQQDSVYRAMYSVPLTGRAHHPAKDLIAEAVKWIHEGGLNDMQ
jgi:hypothetical protein